MALASVERIARFLYILESKKLTNLDIENKGFSRINQPAPNLRWWSPSRFQSP